MFQTSRRPGRRHSWAGRSPLALAGAGLGTLLLSLLILTYRVSRGTGAEDGDLPPTSAPYTLTPLQPFGVEVSGVDLTTPLDEAVVERIKEDVTKHRLLLFRGQGSVSGERHVEIGRWFGALDDDFTPHERSPHRNVYRLSNDPAEGTPGGGRPWHNDGVWFTAPTNFALYHMVAVPQTGGTQFVGLAEVVRSMSPEQRARYERLSQMVPYRKQRRGWFVHPLIYSHPATGEVTMNLNLAFPYFMWDAGTPNERQVHGEEAKELIKELHSLLTDRPQFIYTVQWREGDFAITDNRALAHRAEPRALEPQDAIGLRILHRVTVLGTVPPRKNYRPEF